MATDADDAAAAGVEETAAEETAAKGFLNTLERLGNKVPSPAIMFLYLIAFLALLSAVLAWADISVTEDVAVPVPIGELEELRDALGGSVVPYDYVINQKVEIPEYIVRPTTFEIRSLVSIDGLRFVFSTFVQNFQAFGVVAVTLIAMAGVGVAEKAGMMAALIRKIVRVAPAKVLAFMLILVGVLSSVASDAGYLILIPLGAAAFLSVGRHPLAGMAAAFAGVGVIFGVNLLITPIDSMITEITNSAIGSGGEPINITANYYFSVVSSLVLAAVAAVITTKIVEPRLGPYDASLRTAAVGEDPVVDHDAEARGLRFALYGLLGCMAVVVLLVAPPGAPLREPETGAIIGTTPFMDSLIFIIALSFLVCGICFGKGAGTIEKGDDAVGAIGATYAGLGGLLLMFLMIAQFIAFFSYTQIPRVVAVEMAHVLERIDIPALALLIAFILVIVLLDFILPGVVPKWAIFAPVFIPIFDRLGIAPQTVQAAYIVGDGPVNVLTPLMVYLPFIVTIAQRYDKRSGIGTIIALMLPYAVIILIAWIILYAAWFLLGIPLGPGSPVEL
jgi:aminobenzoyl-glutamate transport protein